MTNTFLKSIIEFFWPKTSFTAQWSNNREKKSENKKLKSAVVNLSCRQNFHELIFENQTACELRAPLASKGCLLFLKYAIVVITYCLYLLSHPVTWSRYVRNIYLCVRGVSVCTYTHTLRSVRMTYSPGLLEPERTVGITVQMKRLNDLLSQKDGQIARIRTLVFSF